MKDLNDEIKLTLNLMQTDVSDGAREELQFHLYSLLDMKRNRLQRNNSDVFEVASESKPLTTEELLLGGWWCADVSEDCASAFKSKGLQVYNSSLWRYGGPWSRCALDSDGDVTRCEDDGKGNKQIHRICNEFYWGEK